MNRTFWAITAVISLLAGAIGVHYLYARKHTDVSRKLSAVTALTGMVSPALSTAFYEPRLLYTEQAKNPAYPQMPPIDTTSFVYEK
jgi:hypothetical protein